MASGKPTIEELEKKLAMLEQELQHKNEKLSDLRSIFDEIQELAKIGYWELDLINNKLYWSDEIFSIIGCEPQSFEPTYETYISIIHPDDREYVDGSFKQHLGTKIPFSIIHRVLLKDGSVRFVNERCKSDFEANGRPIRSLGAIVDITDRIQLEHDLENAEEIVRERDRNIKDITSNFETFFNTTDDFVFVIDRRGTIIHCNKTVERRLGYSLEELIGKSIMNVHPEEKKSETEKVLADVITGKLDSFQLLLLTKQGKQIHVETRANKGLWNGETVYYAVSKDITKLKLSEERFSSAFYLNPSACGLSEVKTGKYLEVNDAFCTFLGYTREETIGHTAKELNILTEKTRSEILSKADNLGSIYNIETELVTKSGEVKRVLLSAQNVYLQDVTYRFTIVNDVSELLRAKEQAEENEKKFSLLFYACPEPLSVTSLEDGQLLMVNDAFIQSSGYEKEAVINHKSTDLDGWLSTEDRQRWATDLHKNGSIRSEEFQLRTRKNGIRDFLISSEIIEFERKKCALNFYIDITDRKNAETELLRAKERAEESEEKLRNLYESLSITYMILKDGLCVDCNESALVMHGVKNKDELIGKSPADFSPEFQPNHVKSSEVAAKNMETALERGYYTFEWLSRKKNKDVFYAEVSLKKFFFKNELYIQCLSTDITERKRIELELVSAKEKAEESDRLKTAFLQNMSHEIRTPLNAICGFSCFLSDDDLSDAKRKSFVQIIQNSSNQLLSIVSNILTISSLETKQEKVSISIVCINDILNELLAIFKQQASNQNISLYAYKQLSDKQSEIYTDKTKIIQVLSNLISNALKFTHVGSIKFGYQLINNDIEFFIKDTGIGISQELHEKIFERFRQADKSIQSNYGGTGLGLSICKGFVELMGGTIRVESNVGEGSTFYFTLPFKPANEMEVPTPSDNQDKGQMNEIKTVLVAEDDDLNYLYIEEVLMRLPIKIIHAKNGKEAIELFKSNPEVELILMDIKMPVMDGHEAAVSIRSIKPELPIVAQSAYAMDYERVKYEGVFDDYLTKPVNRKALSDIISKYLG